MEESQLANFREMESRYDGEVQSIREQLANTSRTDEFLRARLRAELDEHARVLAAVRGTLDQHAGHETTWRDEACAEYRDALARLTGALLTQEDEYAVPQIKQERVELARKAVDEALFRWSAASE